MFALARKICLIGTGALYFVAVILFMIMNATQNVTGVGIAFIVVLGFASFALAAFFSLFVIEGIRRHSQRENRLKEAMGQ